MALQNIKTDALGNATVIDLDTAASGSITAAAQAITLNLSGDSAYALEVQGTFVGTLQIERTVDGTTWRPVNGALTGVGTLVQTLTAPGSLQGHSGPSLAIRLIATAWTSGTATVMLRAGVGSGAVFMVAPLPAGGNVIGTVGVNNFPATQAVSIATNTPDVTDRAARTLGVVTVAAGTAAIGTVGVTALPVVADAAGAFTLAALNAVGALATAGRATVNIELTGTWVGTVQFQATSDPSGVSAVAANWYPVNAISPQLTALVQQTTTNGQFRLAAGGYTAVRAFMAAFTSGSATAWVNASTAASVMSVIDPVTLAPGANTIGTVNLSKAATPTVAAVPSAATAGTLLAANAARVGAVFFNDSTSLLYLKWGATPTITSYTVKVLAGGYYELPGPIVYSGIITGLWATANGNLLVTEVTP